MTTQGPEPGPPATGGRSGWDDWDTPEPGLYDGPLYDDTGTGWHLDLTDVGWGGHTGYLPRITDDVAEDLPVRYRTRGDGNGEAPPRGPAPPRSRPGARPDGYRARPGRPADGYPGRPDGGAGRHVRPGEVPRRPVPARPGPARPAGRPQPSIIRSSSVMAVGTLASRLTGFLRTLVQVFALGGAALGSAYNTANTLPNAVYNLTLGGILTSVIVPLIVSATKRNKDRGEAYTQRMFTLITLALLVITLVATVAAAPIADLYKGRMTGAELHIMIIFAYFFIPQIFFYGMSSLIGAVLNSRGSFAAPMWTPVVNNVVVIAVLALFMYIVGLGNLKFAAHLHHVSSGDLQVVAIGTTLGIVAQTAALVPALRRVGFRWRPRFDFRRSEARQIGRMGGWMFCYIATTQVAFLVTANVANTAAANGGIAWYTYGWQLFQMPYAVVGISVITALLPRMSAHATDRRFGLVRADFSAGVRLASVLVVPCSVVLAVLGIPLCVLLFAQLPQAMGIHSFTVAEARSTGLVFAMFCLGLLPYMLFQLQLRVFYSLHDSRTPAVIGIFTMTLNIAANYVSLAVLHGAGVVAGLGVAFGLSNVLGAVLAWRILARRLRGLDGWRIGRSLVRMHAAALPAALLAIVIDLVTQSEILTVVLGGALATAMYLLFARALRIEELTNLSRTVLARFGR